MRSAIKSPTCTLSFAFSPFFALELGGHGDGCLLLSLGLLEGLLLLFALAMAESIADPSAESIDGRA